MTSPFYSLVLGVLVVWRVTHLFQAEDGPWEVMARLRGRLGEGMWGKLMDCFYCLSLWVAVPFAALLGSSLREQFLLWPALSAGAILLERATREAPAAYFEERTDGDVLQSEQTDGEHFGPEPREQ